MSKVETKPCLIRIKQKLFIFDKYALNFFIIRMKKEK